MDILNKYKHGTPEGSIYIGRGSAVGNPWVIGKHGTRYEVIEKYKVWLKEQLLKRNPSIIEFFRNLKELDNLLCFCTPLPCHGEVIRDYWNEIAKYDNFDLGLLEFYKKYSNLGIYEPKDDGITHINIYSKGATELGRFLSNLAYSPFTHPEYGDFKCIEGFWFWLSTGKKIALFKFLDGFKAKKLSLEHKRIFDPNFQNEIKEAIEIKINTYPDFKKLFIESKLPFTHYYYYGDLTNPKIIERKEDKWLIDSITSIRNKLTTKNYKVIIAGSRNINDYEIVKQAYIDSGFKATEIVSGKARGVDKLGEQVANEFNLPIKDFPADWDKLGKSAGHIRNVEMGLYADALVAIWDGKSRGTKNMVEFMKKHNKPGYIKLT